MKWLLKEKGNFGPFYIGLKADSSDFMKNFFEWEFPISKYLFLESGILRIGHRIFEKRVEEFWWGEFFLRGTRLSWTSKKNCKGEPFDSVCANGAFVQI